MTYVVAACRAAVVVVFALSFSGKVLGKDAFREFARSIDRMRILRLSYVRPAAVVAVAAEGTTAIVTAIPIRTVLVAGFVLATILTVTFTAVILQNLRRGNRVPCRCFGSSTTPLGALHIIRNACLIIISGLGAYAALSEIHSPRLPITIVASIGGGLAGVVIASFDDLAALLAPRRTSQGHA